MITKCWIIENSAESASAVTAIEKTFPCFTLLDLLDDYYIEFNVTCRVEDVVAIAAMISAFV
jgi:hypothetical protein